MKEFPHGCNLSENLKKRLLSLDSPISGQQLRKARNFNRWTQKMLARRIGAGQSCISEMERGWRLGFEPRWYEERIAKARRVFESEEGGSLRFLSDGSVAELVFRRL